MYPKKVTYLGGQIGNQAWKLGRHWVKTSRIGKPTRRKVEICFGSVLFSLDEWILCSDNQNLQSTFPMDKWSEKNVFSLVKVNVNLIWKNPVEPLTIRYAIEESKNLPWRVAISFCPSTEIKRELLLVEHGKNYGHNRWLTYYIIVKFWAFLPIFREGVAAKLKLLVNND